MENNAAVAEEPQVLNQTADPDQGQPASTEIEEPLKTSKTASSSEQSDDVDAFIQRMSAPRKENKRAFAMTEGEDPEGDTEPITDDDEANLEHLNYSADHRHTALFFIGLIDSAMGWFGMYMTGQEPSRYQKFAGNSQPPDFYVDSAAAMVKKYHARMSLEMMFITALAMVYGPTVGTITNDRKILKEKQMEERIRDRERSARIV